MRKQYNTCPLCHANLDFGEKCDCQSEARRIEEFYANKMAANPVTGQYSFLPDRKEAYAKKYTG